MLTRSALPFLLMLSIPACRPRDEVARDPGSPTPVAGPAVGPAASRADEAPLVRVEAVLTVDSLLGRRARVSGHCTAAGAGPRAGSWTLEDAGSWIEVRGLVPSSCAAPVSPELTIFAQIEPAASGSRERLLLRLPD